MSIYQLGINKGPSRDALRAAVDSRRHVSFELGIPFADLSPIVARIWGISRDGAVSRRRDGDGLFGEPMEEQAARP
jgi:hypothetical protein